MAAAGCLRRGSVVRVREAVAEGEERIRRVVRDVRVLPADALHRGRKLERERSRRCGTAEDDLEQGLVASLRSSRGVRQPRRRSRGSRRRDRGRCRRPSGPAASARAARRCRRRRSRDSPAWKRASMKLPLRGSYGALMRTSATSASSGVVGDAQRSRAARRRRAPRGRRGRCRGGAARRRRSSAARTSASVPRGRAPGSSDWPTTSAAPPASTYGSSKRPSRNLSRSSRRTDTSMRASSTSTRANEVDDDLGAGLAAELVDTRVERLQRALLRAQVLDAPGTGGPDARRRSSRR